jgi:archaeal flagellar protein FlaI
MTLGKSETKESNYYKKDRSLPNNFPKPPPTNNNYQTKQQTKPPDFEEKIDSKQFKKSNVIETYTLNVNNMIIEVNIVNEDSSNVPQYIISISNISETTKLILEKIRQKFISQISLEKLEEFQESKNFNIKERFKDEIISLVKNNFPDADDKTVNMLTNYILQENLGLGKIEILLKDSALEEIVINDHKTPVWVYHRKHGWLETNIRIYSESRIRHYATLIGRNVNKEITTLNPLMDAHLLTGDRVNATLSPISSEGNTITIRKFSTDPWTITKFIKLNVLSAEAAALLWLGIENELSILIAGGTGSGKTSMLNVIANFFPPNQRIISIEDTRELTLPETLHWVPLETRLPNPEGKGGITMLDLVVNSLRMRPDRIVMGEIRRKEEAQVLLEAMHTGHSVYGTIHANNSEETIMRLTNPPINLPKPTISAISMILVQNRNRRTGARRTLQIAEVLPDGEANVLMQLDIKKDKIIKISDSAVLRDRLELYTGLSGEELDNDLKKKVKVLNWLVKNNIENVDDIGSIMSKYYRNKLKIN